MKFSCDRCKTRYSISEDRVRGKILKIRCKNCAAVITVREPQAARTEAPPRAKTPAPAAASAGEKALAGAFRKVGRTGGDPSASSSMSQAPASLEAEWYLAEDGEQEGPFDLAEAKAWIRSKPSGVELFCWSEGYDDWLSVEKIAHFRSLRAVAPARPQVPGGGAVPEQQLDWDEHTVIDPNAGQSEVTPKPLFAAAMARLGSPDAEGKPGPSKGAAKGAGAAPPKVPDAPVPEPEADANLEFEIGEASRVVSLPLLVGSGAGAAAPARSQGPAPLPGIKNRTLGRGSGNNDAVDIPDHLRVTAGGADLPRPELLKPSRGQKLWIPIAAAAVVLIGAITVLVIAFTGGDSEPEYVARGGASSSGLGHNFDSPQVEPGEEKSEEAAKPSEPAKTAKRNTGGPSRPRAHTTGGSATKPRNTGGMGEVDLSRRGGDVAGGPLDGDDLMRVYRKNQIAIKMCYERALKQDPLLRVPKTWVSIKVNMSGAVTSVSIPALAGTPLGSCMRARISRWKFRKTSEVFSSRFPVVFDS
jgi:predicted Zn finger-like uncharacterized protein